MLVEPPHVPPITYPATRSHTCRLRTSFRNECDALPEPPAPLDISGVLPEASASRSPKKRLRLVPFETPADAFGCYRIYLSRPTTIPDSACSAADFSDLGTTFASPPSRHSAPLSLSKAIAPCPNLSTLYLQNWFWKDGGKSQSSREDLRSSILLWPGFNPQELVGVNFKALDQKLADAAYSEAGNTYPKSEGWMKKSVSIQIPMSSKAKSPTPRPVQSISIPGMLCQVLLVTHLMLK